MVAVFVVIVILVVLLQKNVSLVYLGGQIIRLEHLQILTLVLGVDNFKAEPALNTAVERLLARCWVHVLHGLPLVVTDYREVHGDVEYFIVIQAHAVYSILVGVEVQGDALFVPIHPQSGVSDAKVAQLIQSLSQPYRSVDKHFKN